jgi:hypothetical protein
MVEKVKEAIDAGRKIGGEFNEQLVRLREFRERMMAAGAVSPPEQVAVRILVPVPRRTISLHR